MSMLDYEGAEVLMIPEKHDASEVLEDTALEKGTPMKVDPRVYGLRCLRPLRRS